MDYETGAQSDGWKKIALWGLVLIGGPLLILGALGAFIAMTGTPEQQFDRMAENDPTVKPMLQAMKTLYPEEYTAFRAALVPLLDRKPDAMAIRSESARFMRGFNERHRAEVSEAPERELRAFFDAQLRLFEAASKQSASTCGAIAQGRVTPPGPNDKDLAPLLGLLSQRYIEAAGAGHDKPTKRRVPGLAEQQQLGLALQRTGLRPAVRARMQANTPPALYSDEDMCNATLSVLQAIHTLPVETGLRIAAEIVRTS
jgi:hypothetical protein